LFGRSAAAVTASNGLAARRARPYRLPAKQDLPMLRTFCSGASQLIELDVADTPALPARAVWIDLLNPTREEELFVEKQIGLQLPTREDMAEIEPSSRVYEENGALYLTANVVVQADTDPASTPIAFVLTPTYLVTVRYADPKSFMAFAAHVERSPALCADANSALVFLLEAIVDRLADVLEGVSGEIDNIAKATFRRSSADGRQRMTNEALRVLLGRIGRAQDLVSKSRESAVSLSRVVSFLSFAIKKDAAGQAREHIKSMQRDLASLTDHATYLGGTATFLLDAALGLISIEQNAIIKIFSVAAVIFLPPTLVASIYGMNFEFMPELGWHYGYPFAIGAMIVSAIVPYLFFRARGWL
jgi:magnesium transporter